MSFRRRTRLFGFRDVDGARDRRGRDGCRYIISPQGSCEISKSPMGRVVRFGEKIRSTSRTSGGRGRTLAVLLRGRQAHPRLSSFRTFFFFFFFRSEKQRTHGVKSRGLYYFIRRGGSMVSRFVLFFSLRLTPVSPNRPPGTRSDGAGI